MNGENIPSDALRDITLFVRDHSEAMAEISGEHPTEFELMTAVAFEHFARSECDIVVCEVGLGGRLDSTNIIDPPEACVITRIGLDHTEFLGDTPAKVAAEKAGIIKPGSAVVSWPQEDEGALQAIVDAAKRCGANVVVPDMGLLEVGGVSAEGIRSFTYGGESFTTKLLGSYQPSNAALAIETARQLRERGWKLTNDVIERGVANTSWPGRFEVVSDDVPVVVVYEDDAAVRCLNALDRHIEDFFCLAAAFFTVDDLYHGKLPPSIVGTFIIIHDICRFDQP